MVDFSKETQRLLDLYSGKTAPAQTGFSPETEAILRRYTPTYTSPFDESGDPVAQMTMPTPEQRTEAPILGPAERMRSAVVKSLQGPYGPADLPADVTNPLARGAWQAIQKPLTAIDYVSRPMFAAGSALGAGLAGTGEKLRLLDRTQADHMQRDLSGMGQAGLILSGAIPGSAVAGRGRKPATVEAPPLATHEPATIGGGYLKVTPEGRVFDVAADGTATPVQPSTQVAVRPPGPTIEPVVPPAEPPIVPTESTAGAMETPYAARAETMSAAERKARRTRDERSQLEQTDLDRRVGGIDDNQYVPGVQRTLGRVDTKHASEEIALRDLFPEPFDAIDKANHAARVEHVESGIPDPISLHNMREGREAARITDIAPMQSNPKPVNVEPVSKLIDRHLAEGGEDRSYVDNVLRNVKRTLYDADGNLRDDPMRLYNGARKNITDKLERAKADPKSDDATAQHHLVEIKDALDKQIADTNPSFRTYLDNYAKASGPIDEAELMQDIRKKITNAKGEVQLSRIDNILNAIDTARSKSKGANPAQHLTDETLQRLYDLRNDMQAEEARNDMARVVGSNTHLKFLQGEKYKATPPSAFRNGLTNFVEGALHTASAYVDPGFGMGNQLIRIGADKLTRAREQKAAEYAAEMQRQHEAAQQARLQQFLNPKRNDPNMGHNGGPPLDQ